MSDLTAIDTLINPDASMMARAKEVNQRVLQSVPPPQGFALDEHHQPHITVLQRYVETSHLDDVFEAVGKLVGSVDASSLTFTTIGIHHMEVAAYPGIGLSGIVVKPSDAVLDFQTKLIEALKPFTRSGGTGEAYVRTEAEPDINDATINYIENYVPDHSGPNYIAHVTCGLATLDDLKTIEAEPMDPLTFGPAGISVYQLGNNGTAAKHLKDWSV
jgi:hypothetical protein